MRFNRPAASLAASLALAAGVGACNSDLTSLNQNPNSPENAPAGAVFTTAVENYPGWGGYGSSKAALDHLAAILAVEHPEFGVYAVDPGDMNTHMHQEAFPGEDISDRPPPEASVPGLVEILTGALPSGRYQARALPAEALT